MPPTPYVSSHDKNTVGPQRQAFDFASTSRGLICEAMEALRYLDVFQSLLEQNPNPRHSATMGPDSTGSTGGRATPRS